MFAFLLFLVVAVAADPIVKQENIKLVTDKTLRIQSPLYPRAPDAGTRVTWFISSEPDTNILLYCEDLRISPSENCKDGYFLVFDGNKEEKFCKTRSGFTTRSVNNEMKLEFDVYWTAGVAKCEVTAVGKDVKDKNDLNYETENIKLELNGKPYDKMIYTNINRNRKKTWNFETSADAKITLYCTKIYLGHSCKQGYLKTSSGKKICGTRYFQLLDKSVSSTLTVEVTTNDLFQGVMDCLVQAVNGDRPFQFMNLKPEEVDSSEYGQGNGVKSTTCDCGFSRKSPARIVNGDYVDEAQYPWIVGLLYNNRPICGGSIITEEHVLTAAHCTHGKYATNFKVITGTINVTRTQHGQIIPVKQIIEHDFEITKMYVNDAAIMWLSEKIKFSPHVGRICLTPNKIPLDNKYITVMGWGSLGQAKGWQSPQMMMRAHVRVVDYNTCSFIWYRRLDTAIGDRICVWEPRRTACFGDSGGPLVWHDPETKRYVQVALVSFGRDGCGFEVPQVNSNVAHFYPWIMKVIRETSPVETCVKN